MAKGKGKTVESMSAPSASKKTYQRSDSALAAKMNASKAENKAKFGAPKVRTMDELMAGSTKDKVFALFRLATGLAKKNGYEGTVLANVKSPNGAIYAVSKDSYTGKKSPFWRLDESQLSDVIEKGKAAQGSIASASYDGKVKSFIDAFMSLGGSTGARSGGGAKNRDYSVAANIKF